MRGESQMNWTMFGVLLKIIELCKKMLSWVGDFFEETKSRKIKLYNRIANKYYNKVCTVKYISNQVRGIHEDDMSGLRNINQAICYRLGNLHRLDEINLDLSEIKVCLGEKVRELLINIEEKLSELDRLGVGASYAFSIDSSKVGCICNKILCLWYKLLEEIGKNIGKKVDEMEQELWDKHNPS
jgi:hypothetical protein